MKKILGIVAVCFLWCNFSFALTQQSAIDQYLSDRKLDTIEGVWINNTHGGIYVAHKTSGNSYTLKIINHKYFPNRQVVAQLTLGSESVYYGKQLLWYSNSDFRWCNSAVYNLVSIDRFNSTCDAVRDSYSRIWPSNFVAHNKKFDEKKVAEKAKDKNKVQASSGTAFFVTNKGHAITNYHVVEGCKDKSKIIYQGTDYKAKLIAKDKYLDLALLKSDLQNENYISISNKSPKKLQRIIAAGYPLGKELSDDLKFTSGIVSSLKGLEDDSTRIQIDAALNYGNSGGPIVDEKTGELIAVAVAGLDKQVTESINFGIKAGSVKNFLDSNQINLDLNTKKFNLGNVDLASILESATVYTFCK